MRTTWVLLAVVSGCLPDQLVECEDGRLCPADKVCDVIHATCVDAEQQTACAGEDDGTVCTAAGAAGICDAGTCLPGCGDGAVSAGEECDDGNFASHDGCSSGCLREVLTWERTLPPWRGRSGHVAGYSPALGLFVVGGHDGVSLLADQWERSAAGVWTQRTTDLPPPRRDAAMAYDSARDVFVLFGGADAYGRPLADTWERAADGVWREQTPATAPPARFGHAMAFDAVTSTIVMFGGTADEAAFEQDVWTRNGQQAWQQRTLATPRPPPRTNANLVWDPVLGEMIMFGGSAFFSVFNDTWALGSTGWTDLALASAPDERSDASMAYDPTSGLVLFGGFATPASATATTWHLAASWSTSLATGPAPRRGATLTHDGAGLILVGGQEPNGTALADVWRFAGSQWTPEPTSLWPTGRTTAIAYDETRGTILMSSGLGAELEDDTWSFDGRTWNALPSNLGGRAGHSLAYNSSTGCVVSFGGVVLQPVLGFTNDMFQWCGATWMSLATSGAPSPRVLPGLVYDAARDRLVLFGGRSASQLLGDTWVQDSTGWIDRGPAPSDLAPEESPAMAYDPVEQRVVLFAQDGTTWTFEPSGWSKLVTTGAPPRRAQGALVFDAARRKLVLYGGNDGSTYYDDTIWVLDGTTWTPIEIVGERPPVRTTFGFAAERRRRAFVLFGGSGQGTYFDDTWVLQSRSSTPDEDCSNGVDDDGDDQRDDTDPDCQ